MENREIVMKEVVITAAVVATALGDLEETWQGLNNGRSALAPEVLAGSLANTTWT